MISYAEPQHRVLSRLPFTYMAGVYLLLGLLLLPRIITTAGDRTIINLVHYPLTLILYLIAVLSIKPDTKKLHIYLAIMLAVMWASALYNSAGLINIFIQFLLLCQPFMIIAFMVSREWSPRDVRVVEWVVFCMITLHTAMAYYQASTTSNQDDVKGLFLGMGAGHHVGGAVALSAAIYFIRYPLSKSFLVRWLIPILAAGVVIISDSKQVILVFGLSLGVMFALALKDVARRRFNQIFKIARFTVLPAILVGLVTLLAVPESSRQRMINDAEEGFTIKFSVFPIIYSYHDSFLNLLVGLGPGHTITRLAELFQSYKEMLLNMGGTFTKIPNVIKTEDFSHYLTHPATGTSLFSMRFSWAGIWGDIGTIGIVLYLITWFYISKHFCKDQLTKFFVINILLFGITFAWLEEPAYIGIIAIFIGLQLHKDRAAQEPAMIRSNR